MNIEVGKHYLYKRKVSINENTKEIGELVKVIEKPDEFTVTVLLREGSIIDTPITYLHEAKFGSPIEGENNSIKIEAGKTYKHKRDEKEIAIVNSVLPGIEKGFVVTFRDNYGTLHTSVERDFLEEYHVSEEIDLSKPSHCDTTIDTIAFAKANFPTEQVEGFFRISVIECLQPNEGYNLESLNKASQYIQELISMKSKQKEIHT